MAKTVKEALTKTNDYDSFMRSHRHGKGKKWRYGGNEITFGAPSSGQLHERRDPRGRGVGGKRG